MTDIERVAREIDPRVFELPKVNLYRARYEDAFDTARRIIAALRRPDSMEVREAHLRANGSWDVT